MLRIESWGLAASIEWHQGEVREASLGALRGAAAVRELGFVRDGSFALRTEQPVCLDAPVPVRTAEPLAGTVAVTRAARPAPPPLPARTQPARGQIVRPQLAVPAWPQYAYAVTAQARPAPAMSRLRLPSVTLSLGILCLTMFCSLLAIQL